MFDARSLWVLVCCMGGLAGSALALDVVESVSPQEITDRQVTIGPRTLQLPEGDWHLIARQKGRVTSGIDKNGDTYRVYAVDTNAGRFRNGVDLLLMFDSFYQSGGWKPEPCKVEGQLFKDDFNSGFKFPECLVVYKRTSHLSKPSGEFYPQAAQWLEGEKVKLPGPVYEIVYTKYAQNTFGQIRVMVPVKNVAGDDAVVAWAQGLPERLRKLFERRETDATLPPIPSKF